MPVYVLVSISSVIILLILAVAFSGAEKRAVVKLINGFCGLPVLGKILVGGLLAVATAIGGSKNDSTNTPPLTGMFWFPQASQQTAITANETNLGYRVVAEDSTSVFASPSQGAVTNEAWRLCGGVTSAFRLVPDNWYFPFLDTCVTGLTVIARGDFRPDISMHFFPSVFAVPLAFLPLKNQSLLPDGIVSCFWHEQTASNSLILTWQNVLYNRDLNCLTNFQAELFTDGSFVYRYPNHVVSYAPVFPFDWDGDGLENSVDPEPLVAGPDAHGTNAEWYNTVCSNVFSAVDGPEGVVLTPRTDSVKTNAYYFVDVLTERGPSAIAFQTKQRGLLGTPVIVAASGVTNHVPLLIGATYAVTSNVPFQISVRSGDDALICTNDSRHMTINWPLTFSFVEGMASSNRCYTVSVSPDRVEDLGLFSWNTRTNGTGCTCWSGVNRHLTFSCTSLGACAGGCAAHGLFTLEGVPFMVSGGECRCGFEDPVLPGCSDPAQTNGVNVSVAFSTSAVIFEESFVDSYVTVRPRRSSRVALTISADGGTHGGTLHLQHQNLNKLRMLELGPRVLPTTVEVAPCQSYSESYIYEAEHESGYERDVQLSGYFVENETGQTNLFSTALTVVRVELSPDVDPPDGEAHSLRRHTLGVCEGVTCRHYPSSVAVVLNPIGGGTFDTTGGNHYVCPLSGCSNPLQVEYGGATYRPRLSVVEPESVEATLLHGMTWASVVTNFPVGIGQAGGIGMLLKLRVRPCSVSFSNILIEEVPQFTYEASGYFTNRYYLGRLGHTTLAGAGNWLPVDLDNKFAEDTAAFNEVIPWLTPNGTVTQDPAFSWTDGTVYIDNPFGWNSIETQTGGLPHKMFAVDTQDEITLFSDGKIGVRKLFNQVSRETNGVIRLNGRMLAK